MIRITTKPNDKNFYVRFETSIGWTVELMQPRSCEMDAILLANQLRNDLCKRMEEIRKQAYDDGWKDKASKKVKKKTCFSGTTDKTNYVGY